MPPELRAADHDLVTGEFFGQLRIDADDEELALAARQRLLQRAVDRIGADGDFGDLVGIEQRLEFAVRYGLDLRVVAPKLLEQQHADRGGHKIPDHELALARLRFHGHGRPLCQCASGSLTMAPAPPAASTLARAQRDDIDMPQNLPISLRRRRRSPHHAATRYRAICAVSMRYYYRQYWIFRALRPIRDRFAEMIIAYRRRARDLYADAHRANEQAGRNIQANARQFNVHRATHSTSGRDRNDAAQAVVD